MNTIKRTALVLTASVFANVVLACCSDGLTFGGKGANAADGGGSAEATVVVVTCDRVDPNGQHYAEAIFAERSVEDLVSARAAVTPQFGNVNLQGYTSHTIGDLYFADQRVAAMGCGAGDTVTFVLP